MREELSIYFENPATDPLGHECLEGKLFCARDGITLRYKLKDRAFKKSEPTNISLGYAEVESIKYRAPFFGPKILTLRSRDSHKLDEIPGSEVGKLELHVIKDSRDEAEKAANFVEYRQSEIYLKEQDDRLSDSRDSAI